MKLKKTLPPGWAQSQNRKEKDAKKHFFTILFTLCITLSFLLTPALAEDETTATVANFSELEAALHNADVSTITVTADITFTKTLNITRSITFTADQKTTFSLADGFIGRHFSVNAPSAEIAIDFGPIILDGGGNAGGLNISVTSPVSLTGGTIQNCKAAEGGAIKAVYSQSSQPDLTLAMSQISQNSATSGGAIYLDSTPNISAKLVVNGGEISENTASRGGAIFSSFGKELEIAGGVLDHNTTTGYGGAIYLTGGTFRISGGEISNNTAVTRGGAIYMAGGPIEQFIYIDGGTFHGNKAEKSGFTISMGGAICMNNRTTFAMSAGTFSENSASSGGAICQENNASRPFSITGGEFIDNITNGSQGGGAICLQQNAQTIAATFTGVTFSGNKATHTSGGGGAVSGSGAKTFTNCTFENNTAASGGAISHSNQSLTLSDCTFTKNSATNGGAVSSNTLNTEKLLISQSTFSNNTAQGFGGAISASPLEFIETNSVIFENNKGRHAYPNLPAGTIETAHTGHIIDTSYSKPFDHVFNNYDIGPNSNNSNDVAAMGTKYFRVELKAGANGSLANSSSELSFIAEGNDLTLDTLASANPTPALGYAFDRWETEDGVEAVFPLTIRKDIVLTATFVKIPTLTLTFETNGGSPVAPITAVTGSKIELNQETARNGYKFNGWYEDSALTKKLTEVTLTEDKTVYAGWSPISTSTISGGSGTSILSYSITFETNGGSPVSKIIKVNGSKITLNQTTTRQGYIFTGWYNNQTLNERITSVTLTQNITVYAGWRQKALLNQDPKLSYMKGTDLGLFLPDANMTRAEIATMFYRLLLDQNSEGDVTFNDIPENEWYTKPILVLASKGILQGENGSIRPNDNITRAEFVTIASRLIAEESSSKAKQFIDVDQDHWALNDISRISALGYIDGYPDGTFRPGQNITRAEAVKITNCLLNRIPDKDTIDTGAEAAKSFLDVTKAHWAYYEIYVAVNGI